MMKVDGSGEFLAGELISGGHMQNSSLFKQKWTSELESNHDITMAHEANTEEEAGSDNFSGQPHQSIQVSGSKAGISDVAPLVDIEYAHFINSIKENVVPNSRTLKVNHPVRMLNQSAAYGVSERERVYGNQTSKDAVDKDVYSNLVTQISKLGSRYSLTNIHLTRLGNKLTVWIRDYQQPSVSKAEELLALISDAIKDTDFEVEKVMLNGRSLADVKHKGVNR
ncbi:hypothetical protein BTA51_00040 [Hahella sp. CCB-MM4]|uniref:hypothetical protein n=1 Tax=Hahella sp. (strain CCB-MM4) TaxID=1926491 RepID=UPI000B9C2566|nr:hypothetical protein [Hahella sp. CCB-MM4]OZG74841.1 hypothetical protein BTA51_00040 [Hahella sp. CCB-MM4]